MYYVSEEILQKLPEDIQKEIVTLTAKMHDVEIEGTKEGKTEKEMLEEKGKEPMAEESEEEVEEEEEEAPKDWDSAFERGKKEIEKPEPKEKGPGLAVVIGVGKPKGKGKMFGKKENKEEY